MSDIILQQSNSVEYYLKSEGQPALKIKEPIGWQEDGFEFIRNDDYHGILTEFTTELQFFKDAKEYLEEDYLIYGINSNLKIKKYEILEVGGKIKWDLVYEGSVDYSSRKINDNKLALRFNSNDLENILKTREDDEFDLERNLSINDESISLLKTELADFEGTELIERNSLVVNVDESLELGDEGNPFNGYVNGRGTEQRMYYRGGSVYSPVLNLVTDSLSRVSSPDTTLWDSDLASRMFFVDKTVEDNVESSLKIAYEFKSRNIVLVNSFSQTVYVGFYVYRKKEDLSGYDLVRQIPVAQGVVRDGVWTEINAEGEIEINNIAWNEGIIFGYYDTDDQRIYAADIYNCTISLRFNSVFPPSQDHKFLKVHDAFNRLTEIMTGSSDRFVSRMFGSQSQGYFKDGKYSGVGLINGFWIRKWPSGNDIYKSIVLSFKDLYESVDAVFNVGLGIEYVDGKQKIVVEDSRMFYQNKIGLRLTKQASNISRETISSDFISSIELGYDKGGEYSDALGVDEPNVRTRRITPIVKNKREFRKVSRIRADDIGFEQSRRQPFSLFPDNKLSEDEHVWFLDLKKETNNPNENWIQKVWQDRLRYAPTNLSYSETFRSFLFSPLRMLFRHGRTLRIGLNQNINMDRTISHISSEGNSSLYMQFLEDDRGYSEDESIQVRSLERPLVEPEVVRFNYKIDNDFVQWIKGKTSTVWEGENITLPNYYFKVEFINEFGLTEKGFINAIRPKINEIELIKSNEKILENA